MTEPPTRAITNGALRILLVDDNADANESMATLLEMLGHVVATAHDGPTAVATARTFLPELVLCDIGLPGMDGYQTVAALRADNGQRKTVFVAVTGYGHDSDRKRALATGFDDHLVKPLDAETLLAFVDRLANAPGSDRID